jgi:hypothetical protein
MTKSLTHAKCHRSFVTLFRDFLVEKGPSGKGKDHGRFESLGRVSASGRQPCLRDEAGAAPRFGGAIHQSLVLFPDA